MADRYTYIPLIGLFITVAWGVPDLLKKWNYQKEILLASSALSILCLSIITWTQVGYWQNDITLFDHTVKVTDYNWLIYNNRGAANAVLGNYMQTIEDCGRSIEIKPGFANAYNNRGFAYNQLGNYKQAIEDYDRAIEIKPAYAEAYYNRGIAYTYLGNYRQAIEDYSRAIEIKPGYAEAYYNRGIAYTYLGNYRQAIEDCGWAIEIKPDYTMAYYNRAIVYLYQGDNISGCHDVQKACELGNCKLLEAANARGLCR
jgi:tetratricopeptide (TPR) repeat protein